MDVYERCTNLGKKNLADSVAIYGRGRELFRPPTMRHPRCGQSKCWNLVVTTWPASFRL